MRNTYTGIWRGKDHRNIGFLWKRGGFRGFGEGKWEYFEGFTLIGGGGFFGENREVCRGISGKGGIYCLELQRGQVKKGKEKSENKHEIESMGGKYISRPTRIIRKSIKCKDI